MAVDCQEAMGILFSLYKRVSDDVSVEVQRGLADNLDALEAGSVFA